MTTLESLVAHVLIGKPVATFPGHALIGPQQQRDPANHEQHAERFARGGALAEGNARDKLREQNFDQRKRAHAGGVASAKARNQNCEATAPAKPADSDGFHARKIANRIVGLRSAR